MDQRVINKCVKLKRNTCPGLQTNKIKKYRHKKMEVQISNKRLISKEKMNSTHIFEEGSKTYAIYQNLYTWICVCQRKTRWTLILGILKKLFKFIIS